MRAGCLGVVCALAAAFFLGAFLFQELLGGDPCDSSGGAGVFALVGVLCAGAAAGFITHSAASRAWVGPLVAFTTVLGLGFGLYLVLLFRWVGNCAN